jgi:hypothetical protein
MVPLSRGTKNHVKQETKRFPNGKKNHESKAQTQALALHWLVHMAEFKICADSKAAKS